MPRKKAIKGITRKTVAVRYLENGVIVVKYLGSAITQVFQR